MKTTKVHGIVDVIDYAVESHYHNGKLYYSVEVKSDRKTTKSTKTDYLRLYVDTSLAGLFAPGVIVEYTGTLVKSKITESLSDIAVAVDTVQPLDVAINPTMGSTVELEGKIIKINKEVVNNGVKSVSMLVANESDDGRRVIVKLTGIGRTADIITTFNLNDMVDVKANIYSYLVKNKDLSQAYYLHDSRITSIELL